MKKLAIAILLVVQIVGISTLASAQVTNNQLGLSSQFYSKEITEYRAKGHISKDILQIGEKEIVEVRIDAITASTSGELTSVVYDCKSQKKAGLIFAFWSDRRNNLGVFYKECTFRDFEFEKAKDLLNNLELVIDKEISLGNDNNVVYKWEDILFIFYASDGISKIRVFWGEADSEWSVANFRTTKKRFERAFKVN